MGFRGGFPPHGRGFGHPPEMGNFDGEMGQDVFRGRGRGFGNEGGHRRGHSLLNPNYSQGDNKDSEYYNEEEFSQEEVEGGGSQEEERQGWENNLEQGGMKRERSEERGGDRRSDWKNRDDLPQRQTRENPSIDRDRSDDRSRHQNDPERPRRGEETDRSRRTEEPDRTRYGGNPDSKRSRTDPEDVDSQNPFADEELTLARKLERSSEECRLAAEIVREKLMVAVSGGVAKEVVIGSGAREEKRAGRKSRWGEGGEATPNQVSSVTNTTLESNFEETHATKVTTPNGAKNGAATDFETNTDTSDITMSSGAIQPTEDVSAVEKTVSDVPTDDNNEAQSVTATIEHVKACDEATTTC